MKYYIDYQYLPKNASRPNDNGTVVPIEVDDSGFALIPNVGDFFSVDPSALGEEATDSFQGRVRTRLFHYIRTPSGDRCFVNIVVEETDDDWGKLIKE